MSVAPRHLHRACLVRGQAIPLLLVVLALAAAGSLLLVEAVHVAGEDARAQVGADAAALAGAGSGPGPASEVARANDAEVVAFAAAGTPAGVTVRVTVTHRRATAGASAEALGAVGSGPGSGREGLAPVVVAALARADQLLGWRVPAAPVDGTGLRVEVPPEAIDGLLAVSDRTGLCQPLAQDHPVHFEPCPPTRP